MTAPEPVTVSEPPSRKGRDLAELAGGLVVLAGIWILVRLFVSESVVHAFFGLPARDYPSGGAVWSNLVASVVCLVVVWWRIRAKMIAHHVAQMTAQRRHHEALMTQHQTHHQAQMALLAKQHSQLSDQVAGSGERLAAVKPKGNRT